MSETNECKCHMENCPHCTDCQPNETPLSERRWKWCANAGAYLIDVGCECCPGNPMRDDGYLRGVTSQPRYYDERAADSARRILAEIDGAEAGQRVTVHGIDQDGNAMTEDVTITWPAPPPNGYAMAPPSYAGGWAASAQALDRTHAERLAELAAAEREAGRSRLTESDRLGAYDSEDTCEPPALTTLASYAGADRHGLTAEAWLRYVTAARRG